MIKYLQVKDYGDCLVKNHASVSRNICKNEFLAMNACLKGEVSESSV